MFDHDLAVLVIGAGASVDANLPSGDALKAKIAGVLTFRVQGEWPNSRLKGDEVILDHLKRMAGRDTGRYRELCDASEHIQESMPLAKSIDHFLHSNRGNGFIETIGKIAIARTILQAESASRFHMIGTENGREGRLDLKELHNTWYVRFGRLLCSCRLDELDERLENVRFIVFNYDRCLEHFLLWAFRIHFALDEATAASYVNKIKIYHPYGTVGRLPWQTGTGPKVRFGENADDLIQVATQVRTFTEGQNPNQSEILAIRKSLEDAANVIFLGCGFHNLNMRLIAPKPAVQEDDIKTYYATAFGISEPDRAEAEERLSNLVERYQSKVHIGGWKCAELFDRFSFALSSAFGEPDFDEQGFEGL